MPCELKLRVMSASRFSNSASPQRTCSASRAKWKLLRSVRTGFDAASMNDITREAGVSKGTIYVYFANKVELFEALVDEERCGMFNNMYDVPNQGGNLRETLIRFGVALVSKVTSKKAIMAQRVVIGASERIPKLGARFYEQGPLHGHAKLQAFLRLSGEAGIARHRRHWSGGLPALGAFRRA